MKKLKKMTKTKKLKHIQALRAVVENHGFTLDKWDNYEKDDIRIKFKNINLRIEIKGYEWIRVLSKPIVKISIENLCTFLEMILKRNK